MTQYKDIPQPTDQRNVSQGDLRNNYLYLCTPISGGNGTPGIFPVDHQATGDNVVNPADGFHKQVSFLNQTPPVTLVNSVNGQSSNGIEYTANDLLGNPQLNFYNGVRQFPITTVPIRAMVTFDGAGNILNAGSAQFNVTNVVKSGIPTYIINFTTPIPTNFYFWSINGFSPVGTAITGMPRPSAVYATFITTTSIEVIFINPAGTAITNLTAGTVQIFGG